jgi:hypothetical protein
MPLPDDDTLRRALERAKDAGFYGFGGLCAQAAVAINRSLLAGEGQIVGAFNAAFHAKGRAIGHVAVQVRDGYWDSDARKKSADEILSWGMLDPDDPDYSTAAEDLGIAWTDEAAEDVVLVALSEDEALALFGRADLDALLGDLPELPLP